MLHFDRAKGGHCLFLLYLHMQGIKNNKQNGPEKQLPEAKVNKRSVANLSQLTQNGPNCRIKATWVPEAHTKAGWGAAAPLQHPLQYKGCRGRTLSEFGVNVLPVPALRIIIWVQSASVHSV